MALRSARHRPLAPTRRWLAHLIAAWLLVPASAAADLENIPLHHSAWDRDDGAPTEVEALAQTPDGALWLGTASGLVRFDGVGFDDTFQARLPRRDIAALLATPAGDLWIGYRRGGLSRLRGNEVSHFGPEHGLPEDGVHAIALGSNAVLWVATPAGLMRGVGEHWTAVTAAQGYPGKRPTRLFVDRSRSLWISDADGLFKARPDGRFERAAAGTGLVTHLAQTPDGVIWASDPAIGLRRVGEASDDAAVKRSGPLLVDRHGHLWISTLPGLQRAQSTAPLRTIPVRGAGESAVLSMLEDREGVIWLGTRGGLERLRPAKFAQTSLPTELDALAAADREAMSCSRCPTPHASLFLALAPAGGGAVWAGSRQHLLRVDGEVVGRQTLGARISSAYRDPVGRLWLGGEASLWRQAGDRFDPVELPSVVDDPQDQVQAMTLDRDGRLWVSIARKGVYMHDDPGWKLSGGIDALPHRPAIAMLTDSRGRLWFTYKDSRVAALDGESLQIHGPEDGLDLGPVLALAERNGHVWLGGERGLMYHDETGFHRVSGIDGTTFADSSGLVETRSGDLWLNTGAGAVRIGADEIEQVLQDSRHRVAFERFDHRDGLDGYAEQIRPLPTVIEADDGRLWFATTTTLASIDPTRITRNPLPPPVQVTSLFAGGEAFQPGTDIDLPPGTAQVQIDYSAMSLAMPERVRFRYRLEGIDQGWRDAGTRRSAFYTNLDRGPHRFEVTASNEDGVWNTQGTTLEFSIAPTMTQTVWFRIFCGVLIFCALWLVYLVRLRQMSERIRVRFEARQSERERIARELHDTLLQGFQGVILRLQAVMVQLRDPMSQRVMERALERADAVLAEGRDRVRTVREGVGAYELGEAVACVGQDLVRDGATRFRIIEQGARGRICPLVRAEVYAICREALFNTVLHASAQSVEVEIDYGAKALSVTVRDDGCGIDEDILIAGRRQGHFGLPGMRERSARLGATIDVRSRRGVGTEIVVVVPALIAYRGAPRVSLLRRVMRTLLAEDVVERAGPSP